MSIWRSCYRKALLRTLNLPLSLFCCRRLPTCEKEFSALMKFKTLFFLPRQETLLEGVAIMKHSFVYLVTVTRGKCSFSLFLTIRQARCIRFPAYPMEHHPHVSMFLTSQQSQKVDDKMCLKLRRKDMNESHNSSEQTCSTKLSCLWNEILGLFLFPPLFHSPGVVFKARRQKHQHLPIMFRVTSNRSQWKSKKTLLWIWMSWNVFLENRKKGDGREKKQNVSYCFLLFCVTLDDVAKIQIKGLWLWKTL